MTEDQKYEIALLAAEAEQRRAAYEAAAITGVPTDALGREKARIAYHIAQTEYLEAHIALERAKARILTR